MRIALLGTGLIGGSLALAWQQRAPQQLPSPLTIVGYDRPEVLEAAEARGALDARATDPASAVDGAEVVVLATPPAVTLRLMADVAPHLAPGALVTDVASVKAPVIAQARDVLPPEVAFLGGHPMAGAETSGIDGADPLLFENAAYVLCLPDGAGEDALHGTYAPLLRLVEATGARPLVLDAARHDRIAAAVSHLPQLLSVALVNTVTDLHASDPDDALRLAAGGFRDMTRIASSPFAMWRDVLVGNSGPVLDALAAFAARVQRTRNRLIEDDLAALESAFAEARAAREQIPRDTKGFLRPLADVHVRLADEPGALHGLTGTLAEANVNVKDIELRVIREGDGGTFRLGFATTDEADEAVRALRDAGYVARRP
jgi:prephenate dehydrogenase